MNKTIKSIRMSDKSIYNRHIKKIRCLDCKHCNVKEKKCYPDSIDCKAVYNLKDKDIYKYRRNDCDFYNMDF